MKLLLKDLNEANISFARILGQVTDGKASYWINRTLGKVVDELKNIEKVRLDLIKNKWGKQEKDGEGKDVPGSFKVPEAKYDDFKKELDELLNVEIDLGANKIPFKYIEPLKISAVDMHAIEKFVEEPEEDVKHTGLKTTPVAKGGRK